MGSLSASLSAVSEVLVLYLKRPREKISCCDGVFGRFRYSDLKEAAGASYGRCIW
jgi:hypothetical protein